MSDRYAPKVIYGTVLMFAVLMGIQSSKPTSAGLAAVEALIAAITIIIAEDYAELIGFTIKNKGPLSVLQKRAIFNDTLTLATFSFTPSLILLASAFVQY